MVASVGLQSCQCAASMSWPPSVAIGYWFYPQRERAGQRKREAVTGSVDVISLETGRRGYWFGRLQYSGRLSRCRCHSLTGSPSVASVGLDVVASIGRPRLLALSAKGNEQGNERERPLLARSMSASGRLHRWRLSPTPLATGRLGYLVASVGLQSCQCAASMSWSPSVALGYWFYPQRVMSRATKAGRNWSPRLLARSMSFPWQLVAVVTWWPVSASSRASVRPRCRGLHRSPSVTGSIRKG